VSVGAQHRMFTILVGTKIKFKVAENEQLTG
jgi:hypothetical protein